METMLSEIADLLIARDLTIDTRLTDAPSFERIWYVSDLADQTIIQVIIRPDFNGHPEFWVQSFASYAAQYIVPIVTRLGDARDEVVQRRLVARRSAQD